jgi:hypothetical protein
MTDFQGRAWLIERFAADGSRLRDELPSLLQYCHQRMAEAQDRAPMNDQAVYGQIWRAVHYMIQQDFQSLMTAQLYRPPSAPYKILVVNGTAIFPWRYAHDAVTKLDDAGFGHNVSATRKGILAGVGVPDMLPLGDLPTEDLPAEDAAEIERHRAAFRETAAEHPVVVVAYASNPAALLKVFWGDVERLNADGTLKWGWREELSLNQPTPPGHRVATVDDDRPSFTSGPLQRPVITARPKSSEAEPGNRRQGSHG